MARGGGGPERRKLRYAELPLVDTAFGRYVLFLTYLLMAVTSLGYLALTWSTVVLLGGFVTTLQQKDFWCLTVISMMQAARIFDDLVNNMLPNFVNLVTRHIYFHAALMENGIRVIAREFRQLPILAAVRSTWFYVPGGIFIGVLIFPFLVMCYVPAFLYVYGPVACIGLASWRIAQRDYGTTGGDTSMANLMLALDMFYSLVLLQGGLYLTWLLVDSWWVDHLIEVRRLCKLPRTGWCCLLLIEYLLDTRAKCWRDLSSIKSRKLIHYAVDLLDSGSWEDNLSGVRLLNSFIRQGIDVRSLLLPSRPKVQKLIDTLGWRHDPQAGASEMRELAAQIVAHLAGDIHLAQFPGAIRCISSLLQDENTRTYWNSDQQQGSPLPQQSDHLPPEKQAMLLRLEKKENVGSSHADVVRGHCNELILQGLKVLERLASDHDNCRDICSSPGLLTKITAPIYSATLICDIRISSWANIVNGSFKVLHCLIHAPGETSSSLRREISSNNQAVSNLESILLQRNRAGQVLQIQAMKILTNLALDLSINLPRRTTENLIYKQLQIFLAGEWHIGMDDLLKATAAEALASLSTNSTTNSDVIMGRYVHTIDLLTQKLDAKNSITCRKIAAEILANLCTHCYVDRQCVKETLLPMVLTEILPSKREPQSNNSAPGNDEENQIVSPRIKEGHIREFPEISLLWKQNKRADQGSEEQTATKGLQEAFLSLNLVIYDKLISADDFNDAVRSKTLGPGAFVANLKTIVQENCHATADSMRIVKLCGQIAVSMMRRNQYTAQFKDQEFVKSLSEALKVVSNLESCMLFNGTDFGPKDTVRPLLTDIKKEAQELLAS